jgi:cytoskeletal protein RodZ
MYAWIWRHLPFGRWGKIGGSVALSLAAMALLWWVAFPAIDPHLPFNEGQVTNEQGGQNGDNVGAGDVASDSPATSPTGVSASPTRSATPAARTTTRATRTTSPPRTSPAPVTHPAASPSPPSPSPPPTSPTSTG